MSAPEFNGKINLNNIEGKELEWESTLVIDETDELNTLKKILTLSGQLNGPAVNADYKEGLENRITYEGTIVGAVSFEILSSPIEGVPDLYAHIYFISVRRRFRRCKVGSTLLKLVKDFCLQNKVHTIVSSLQGNVSLQFWNVNGFWCVVSTNLFLQYC